MRRIIIARILIIVVTVSLVYCHEQTIKPVIKSDTEQNFLCPIKSNFFSVLLGFKLGVAKSTIPNKNKSLLSTPKFNKTQKLISENPPPSAIQSSQEYEKLQHELINSLNFMKGYLYYQSQNSCCDSVQNNSMMLSEIEGIESLIRDFQPEQDLRHTFKQDNLTLVSVEELILSLVSSLDAINDKQIELRHHLSPNLPKIYVNKLQLHQIVINLLTNALNYTDKGSITISTVAIGEQIKIEINDTGIGIRASEIKYLFEPHWRSPRSSDREGSGLGLTIVKELVDSLNGTIKVNSQLNHGTTFSVFLPISPNN